MAETPPTPQASPFEIPSFKAPDVQLLIQDLAQSRRDLFEERKNSANRIAEERDRSRWEMDRIRTEFSIKVKALESENEALVRTLGRMQSDIDRLREENGVLRHSKPAPVAEERAPTPASPEREAPLLATRPLSVPLVMPANPMGAKVQMIPPSGGGAA